MVIYNKIRGINMDFVEVSEHIAAWCDVNGYSIVESHKLKTDKLRLSIYGTAYYCVFARIPKTIWIC